MKIWYGVISFFVLVLAFTPGCGGGGATGSDGGGTTGNIISWAVEATKGGATIDPTNIAQGETVQFVVAGYTASNQRIVQSSSGWQLDPTGQGEGSITSSGQFTATSSGVQFSLSATSGGSTRSGAARVLSPGAFLTGTVSAGSGVYPVGAVIDFWDAGSLVGQSVVQWNGTFRAVLPTTAITFEIDKPFWPAGYYKEYRYGVKWYLPQGLCRAPLPSLTFGQTSSLSGQVGVLSTLGAPPPPPSTCGP